jgi:hypothetical protein
MSCSHLVKQQLGVEVAHTPQHTDDGLDETAWNDKSASKLLWGNTARLISTLAAAAAAWLLHAGA